MQVKIFEAAKAEELEKMINEWLKHRRINIQKMQLQAGSGFRVALILYIQSEPEVC